MNELVTNLSIYCCQGRRLGGNFPSMNSWHPQNLSPRNQSSQSASETSDYSDYGYGQLTKNNWKKNKKQRNEFNKSIEIHSEEKYDF